MIVWRHLLGTYRSRLRELAPCLIVYQINCLVISSYLCLSPVCVQLLPSISRMLHAYMYICSSPVLAENGEVENQLMMEEVGLKLGFAMSRIRLENQGRIHKNVGVDHDASIIWWLRPNMLDKAYCLFTWQVDFHLFLISVYIKCSQAISRSKS